MRGVYTVSFANVSLAAVQDLLGLYAGASTKLEIHGIEIGACTGANIQSLPIRIVRLPATVTSGAGGAVVTPQKTDDLDAAATFTARRNDTTQATTSGAPTVLHPTFVNTTNGWIYWPPREDRPRCNLNGALILSLDAVPNPAIAESITLYIEER